MSKTIYVGRIPFEYTEEQVSDIFRSAGPIQDVRLVFDKDTGKSKGFAFIEYFDPESAASAVRNLDNHPVGHLKLKVDFSNDNNGGGNSGHAQSTQESATGHIANLINEESQKDKEKFLEDLKSLVLADRSQFIQLVAQHPQLGYAIVQTMINMGKIDQNIANTLLPEPPKPAAQNKNSSNGRSKRGGAAKSRSSTPAAQEPKSTQSRTASPAPPAVPAAPQGRRPADAELAMIKQVLAFTQEQLDLLPPLQVEQILELRRKVQTGEILID